MSNLFDDLARTLAKPMPRGRALRTLGAALAVGAIPALRPDRATAGRSQTVPCPGQGSCPGQTKRCCVTIPFGTHESGCYYPDYAKCCTGPNNDSVHPNLTSWTCPKYADCGTFGAGGKICTCSLKCNDGSCCPRNKGRCVDGKCCPAIRTTRAAAGGRVACCPPGTVAVPGARALCCRKGDMDCCDKYDPRKGDDDELTQLGPGKGKLCVNGRIRKG